MGTLSDVKTILANGLKSEIEGGTGETIAAFAQAPTKLGKLFESLPSVCVDIDPVTTDRWSDTDQRQFYDTFLFVDLFCELSENDDGAASDVLIHQMKESAESYLVWKLMELRGANPARIADSKVEGVAFEVQDVGIRMRYAWFRLELRMHP